MIPQHFIDELLTRIDIVDVIDARVSLKKAGREYKACCPFHDEKTPSFTVSPDKQFYHCFGCGEHGSVIGFLMAFDRMSFPEAVEELARQAGMTVPNEAIADPKKSDQLQQLLVILQQADQFYRRQLREHEQSQRAVDYLKDRGLTGDIAARFGIGFAPPGWDNLLTALGSNAAQQKQLLAAGLLIQKDKGGYYDRFRDRIVFPIQDYRGRIVGFGGRLLPNDETGAQGSTSAEGATPVAAKYLNSPETALFHKGREMYGLYLARDAIKQAQKVLVVEGYTDVVALAQFGVDFVVATLGTATTRDHLERLFRYTPEVVFCFDGDAAGGSAAWRALEVTLPILRDGRQVSFLFLPDGEDPDSQIRKIGCEAFVTDISKAMALPEFFFEHLSKEVDLTRMDGRARLVELARPLLEGLPMGALRELMLQRLSEISRVDQKKLTTIVDSIQRQERGQRHSIRRVASGLTPQPSPVRRAITWLLQVPELADAVSAPDRAVLLGLDQPGVGLLMAMLDFIDGHQGATTARILEYFRDTEHHRHLEKLAVHQDIAVEQDVKREFADLLVRLRQQAIQQRRSELANKADLTSEERDELRSLSRPNPME